MADTVPGAVLDTNLLVRFLIAPRGVAAPLLDALIERRYQLLLSELILDELVETLRYPRLQKYGPFSEDDFVRIQGVLRRLARVVPGDYVDVDMVPTDVKDNMIVACALEADADYIVSDDRRDLLPLKVIQVPGFKPVQILSPHAFLRVLNPADSL